MKRLEKPLAPSELRGGWTDPTREMMWSSYAKVLDDLERGNIFEDSYKCWIRGLDNPEAYNVRSGWAEGDTSVHVLFRAQSELNRLYELRGSKVKPQSLDVELREATDALISSLESGELLNHQLVSRFLELARRDGANEGPIAEAATGIEDLLQRDDLQRNIDRGQSKALHPLGLRRTEPEASEQLMSHFKPKR